MEVWHVWLDTAMLRAASLTEKGLCVQSDKRSKLSRFLGCVLHCNSAEPPVQSSLGCSLIGENYAGRGWGRGARVNPFLALELQREKRLVQGNNLPNSWMLNSKSEWSEFSSRGVLLWRKGRCFKEPFFSRAFRHWALLMQFQFVIVLCKLFF